MTSPAQAGTSQDQAVPIYLLKTRSRPRDGYFEHFFDPAPLPPSTADAEPAHVSTYNPVFVPVLQHNYNQSSLEILRSLLLSCAFISTPAADAAAAATASGPPTNLPPDSIGKKYGGLILTSQRAVEALAQVIESLETPLPDSDITSTNTNTISHLRQTLRIPFYTVGPATSRALESLRNTTFPHSEVLGAETGNGEALAGFILRHYNRLWEDDGLMQIGEGAKPPLLFLVGEQRRDVIPRMLMASDKDEAKRITVEEMVVYETGVMDSFAGEFERVLDGTAEHMEAHQWGESAVSTLPRWVCVFSPTGCEAMLRVLGWLDPLSGRVRQGFSGVGRDGVYIATIGPTTREYLEREFGCVVDVCAVKPSPEGLRAGIERFMNTRGMPR
ncbi:hypothetical protein MMC09_006717 [Bachmanniomyces sp. S44760]|nr:hypothetical protein [Bachmanniomyces sp. S44760]